MPYTSSAQLFIFFSFFLCLELVISDLLSQLFCLKFHQYAHRFKQEINLSPYFSTGRKGGEREKKEEREKEEKVIPVL